MGAHIITVRRRLWDTALVTLLCVIATAITFPLLALPERSDDEQGLLALGLIFGFICYGMMLVEGWQQGGKIWRSFQLERYEIYEQGFARHIGKRKTHSYSWDDLVGFRQVTTYAIELPSVTRLIMRDGEVFYLDNSHYNILRAAAVLPYLTLRPLISYMIRVCREGRELNLGRFILTRSSLVYQPRGAKTQHALLWPMASGAVVEDSGAIYVWERDVATGVPRPFAAAPTATTTNAHALATLINLIVRYYSIVGRYGEDWVNMDEDIFNEPYDVDIHSRFWLPPPST